ncbi:TPA: hypothetical protein ACH3X2_007052 [Trebouxia sp. C0005]
MCFQVASPCFFKFSHAAAFCFCCKGVRSSSKPTLQAASFPPALKTFFLSATLLDSTVTGPVLAAPPLFFERRVALATAASVCKQKLPTNGLLLFSTFQGSILGLMEVAQHSTLGSQLPSRPVCFICLLHCRLLYPLKLGFQIGHI